MLSEHEELDEELPGAAGSYERKEVTRNGKKFIKYQKPEEDVKYEELKRLIEAAYACFDSSCESLGPGNNDSNRQVPI